MPDDVAVPGNHSPCVLQRTAAHCNVYLQKALQCGLHLARCVAVCCMPHDHAVPGYCTCVLGTCYNVSSD